MRNYLTQMVFFVFLFCYQAQAASLFEVNEKAVIEQEPLISVFYFAFEIERITGIHEKSMEQYGCHHYIAPSNFKDIIRVVNIGAKAEYDKLDVRAKIMTSGKPFYIDRFGYFRTGEKYGKIDKQKFETSLEPGNGCP